MQKQKPLADENVDCAATEESKIARQKLFAFLGRITLTVRATSAIDSNAERAPASFK
jgi:hypothetical protein